MKIILFAEALSNSAGIERMTVELANLLCKEYEITIILINKYKSSPYRLNDNVTVKTLNSTFNHYLKNIRKLRKYINSIQPDIFISVAIPLVRIAYPALLGTKIKHIAWEHFNLYAGSKIGLIWRLLATKLVDKTVVLTEADKNNYKKHVNSNITCIPNFSTIQIKEKASIKSNIVLAVGRLEHQKGFDLLLQTWSKISSAMYPWKLLIVGSGSQEQELKRLIKSLKLTDSVSIQQATPHIADIYNSSSLFVMSSRFEGLPMVLIEAKMAGLPSVCFDFPNGAKEVIRNGIDGIIVPNGNTDALGSAIVKLASDRAKLIEMGEKAHEDAKCRFSPEAIKSKWINLFNELNP